MTKQTLIGFGILAAGLVLAVGGALLSVDHSNYFFLVGQVLGLAAIGVFVYRFAGDDDTEPTALRPAEAAALTEGDVSTGVSEDANETDEAPLKKEALSESADEATAEETQEEPDQP